MFSGAVFVGGVVRAAQIRRRWTLYCPLFLRDGDLEGGFNWANEFKEKQEVAAAISDGGRKNVFWVCEMVDGDCDDGGGIYRERREKKW